MFIYIYTGSLRRYFGIMYGVIDRLNNMQGVVNYYV